MGMTSRCFEVMMPGILLERFKELFQQPLKDGA